MSSHVKGAATSHVCIKREGCCVGPFISKKSAWCSDSFGTPTGQQHVVFLVYKVLALDETCVNLPHICMPTLSPLSRLASCMSFGLHIDNVSRVSTGTQSLTFQSCSKQSIITHETVTQAAHCLTCADAGYSLHDGDPPSMDSTEVGVL